MLLKQIIHHKQKEIADTKSKMSLSQLKKQCKDFHERSRSLSQELTRRDNHPHLICEMKMSSPSEGVLQKKFKPKVIARQFEEGGASAISVLTDSKYFGGNLQLIREVRSMTTRPILRKDFLLDIYQLYESKSFGADAVLLIASILSLKKLKDFLAITTDLGMEVLVEVHLRAELDRAIQAGAQIVGINNRNLDDLQIDLRRAEELLNEIPKNILTVVESGIHCASDIARYQKHRVDGFLVGTALMKAKNIKEKILELKRDFSND